LPPRYRSGHDHGVPFEKAADALEDLARDAVNGAAVISVSSDVSAVPERVGGHVHIAHFDACSAGRCERWADYCERAPMRSANITPVPALEAGPDQWVAKSRPGD